jgi:hypothetical protein
MTDEIKIKKIIEETKKFQALCPYCKISMAYESENQTINNMFSHMQGCRENPKNKKEKKQ